VACIKKVSSSQVHAVASSVAFAAPSAQAQAPSSSATESVKVQIHSPGIAASNS